MKTFETERLWLRPTTRGDAQFLLELMNSPKWIANIGDRNITSLYAAKKYIKEKIRPQFYRLGYGNYTLIKKNDGLKIGTTGLYDRTGIAGIDIGFALLPTFEKQGYAFESALKVKDLAINNFGLNKLSGITNAENIASQKLLEKLGLEFRRFISLNPESETLLLYEYTPK